MYTPPSGWIEPRPHHNAGGDTELGIFHRRHDCERIKDSHTLRPIDRPYSYRRCRLCASVLR